MVDNTGSSRWYTDHQRLVDFAVLSSTLAVLLFFSWRKWADVLIDTPEELYVPWQLGAGQLLYRDLAHYYGPLSQYFNAAVFTLTEPTFTVLFVTNIFLVCILMAAVYSLVAIYVPGVDRLIVTWCFLITVPIQQHTVFGGYNFLAPYSHEATHGTIAVVVMLAVWAAYLRRPARHSMAILGLLCGACYVLKPEVALAGSVVFGSAVVVDLVRKRNGKQTFSPYGLLALPALPILFHAFFLSHVSATEAFTYTFGAFTPIFTSTMTDNPLFGSLLGRDDPGANLATGLALAAGFLAVAGAASFVGRGRPSGWKNSAVVVLPIFLALAVSQIEISVLPMGFPWFLIVTIAGLLLWRETDCLPSRCERLPLIVLGLVALVFAARMFLKLQLMWLGFYACAPAWLYFMILTTGILPRLSRDGSIARGVCRLSFLAIIVTFSMLNALHSIEGFAQKDVRIGSGTNAMYASNRASLSVDATTLDTVIARLAKLPRERSLLVLPEAVILNFLTGMANETPFVQSFLYSGLYEMAGGDPGVIAELEARPPDYIAYLRRIEEMDSPVYKIRGPGGFANGAFAWIESNYTIIDQIGQETQDFNELQFVLLERNPRQPRSGAASPPSPDTQPRVRPPVFR